MGRNNKGIISIIQSLESFRFIRKVWIYGSIRHVHQSPFIVHLHKSQAEYVLGVLMEQKKISMIVTMMQSNHELTQ
jgi:hypothetical protein